jgi:hypothetical protein
MQLKVKVRELKARIIWLELENEDYKLQNEILKKRQNEVLEAMRTA